MWAILAIDHYSDCSFGVLRSYHVGSPKKVNSNLYEGVQVSYIGLLKHSAV